jgi:glucosylglycerate synthase
MATTNSMTETTSVAEPPGGALLVVLPELPAAQLEPLLINLTASFPPEDLLIAAPSGPIEGAHPGLTFLPIQSVMPSWTLTAADFANAHQLAQKNNARAILILGPESGSLSLAGLQSLIGAITSGPTDLVVPRYDLQPRAGLVNSSILYPISRALFAQRLRFPLAIDLGLSLRMAERLGAVAQRFIATNQSNAPLWPVSEASVAGLSIAEIDIGARELPQPVDPDLNTILPFVTGSLFSDVEAKAAFWQRARVSMPPNRLSPFTPSPPADTTAEVTSLLQGFRLAYTNLREIWGLVLPPNTLIGLKRLSLIDGTAFRMPENLWARIVFDFLIAYRLRTLNRGHLLGALIPLYLAWVASYVNNIASGENPERHIETQASAFEAEKPYLVARWRWPDRFNP